MTTIAPPPFPLAQYRGPVLPPHESHSLRHSRDADLEDSDSDLGFAGGDFISNRSPGSPRIKPLPPPPMLAPLPQIHPMLGPLPQIHPLGPFPQIHSFGPLPQIRPLDPPPRLALLPQIHPPHVLASDPPTADFNEQGLMDEIAKLDERREFLLCQLEKKQQMQQQQLQLLEKHPPSKLEVVAFVDKLQNAHDYFDFKDLLNERYSGPKDRLFKCSDACSFLRSLHDVPRQLNMFKSLSRNDIIAASHAHFLQLGSPRVAGPFPPEMDTATTLLYQLNAVDRYAFTSTTFRFVFLSRHQVYDMDSCPERELEKIKDSPKYFGDFIIFDELAVTWKETDATVVAKRYEEACRKYVDLRLRRSNVQGHNHPKIPGGGARAVTVTVTGCDDQAVKEGSMSGHKRQREE